MSKKLKKDQIKVMVDHYRSKFFKSSRGTALPEIKYKRIFRNKWYIPDKESNYIFIALTIHNQESIITEILSLLIQNSGCNLSIGIMLDNCSDNSSREVVHFFENNLFSLTNLDSVYILESNEDLFECTSENVLFLLCDSDFFVSYQSDLYLNDKLFFKKCIQALNLNPYLLGLSGRAVVPFLPITRFERNINAFFDLFANIGDKRKLKLRFFLRKHGYFGDRSNWPESKMIYGKNQYNKIYFGQAVIRGPIIWRTDYFKKLDGFNDISYYLGRDDCDLSFRGQRNGYSVGYTPINAYSIASEGTSRKPRTIRTLINLKKREILAEKFKGELRCYWDEYS
jgi:hypothetical protein